MPFAFLIIAIRHPMSVFKWRYFHVLTHYILLMIEIAAISYFFLFEVQNAVTEAAPGTSQSRSNYATIYIPMVSSGVLLAALSVLWIDRTWAMYKSGWQVLKPLDLFQDYPENIRTRLMMGNPRRTETIWMSVSRTIIGYGIFIFVATYAVNEIFPFPPVFVETHFSMPSDNLFNSTTSMTQTLPSFGDWNIVITRISTSPATINSSVHVVPNPYYQSTTTPPILCNTIQPLEAFKLSQSIQVVCSWNKDLFESHQAIPAERLWAQILIVVNYTDFDREENISADSVYVHIGCDSGDTSFTQYAEPTLLLPGVNLLGPTKVSYRLTETNKAFSFVTLNQLFPDPSPLIPRSENISTLRIFPPVFTGEVAYTGENKAQTVWGGFSAAGGIWTFLNGVFATVFGQSLFHALLGSKQVSIFGLAHYLQRKRLRDTLLEEYPNLLQQKSDYGLVDLLREHVIDLELIKGSKDTPPVNSGPEIAEAGNAICLEQVSTDPTRDQAQAQEENCNQDSEGSTLLQSHDRDGDDSALLQRQDSSRSRSS